MQNLESSDKSKMFENEPTKLDWMYGNPNHVQDEEYLLGRAVDSSKNHVEHECIPPSIRDLRTANDEDQVDIAKKLQEDPLMEIHRRQIEARKKMLQNPIKLKQMQEMLKKKGKKQSSDDSSNDSSSDEDDLNKKLLEKFVKLQKLKKKKRKKSKHRHSSDNENSDRKKRKKSKKKYSESSNDDRKSRKRSKDSEDEPTKRKKSRKSTDSDASTNDDKKHKHKRHSESTSKRKHKKSYSQEREMQYEKYRNRSNSRERTKHYGLVNADGEKISSKTTSNNKHVEKKSIKRTVEEKKTWVKPPREKLTEEEKEKRRQEMLENVQWKEKTRTKLKDTADDMDKELHKNYKNDPEFLKKYLLKATDIGTVESRIKSNINNIQRRTTDMDSNFARR